MEQYVHLADNIKRFKKVKNGLLIIWVFFFISCNENKPTENAANAPAKNIWQLPRLPIQLESELKIAYPGALSAIEFSDSLINYIHRKYHIQKEKMLLGVSTCVDDIIYTKNFHAHPEIKGPFHLGGLAGFPFTGISGLEAFAHHIPEGGTMILLVEPHIGFSADKGWGYIHRHEQHEISTCCGALMGTLTKLKAGKLNGKITEEDYQGDRIALLALKHKEDILKAETPIITLTEIVMHEAEKQIRAHVLDINLQHIDYIIIVAGVMINTDYQYTDYQHVDELLVYDVKRKTFIDELKRAGFKPD